jgi:hypothetical protein
MNNIHAIFEIIGLAFQGAMFAGIGYLAWRIGRMVRANHSRASRFTR